MAIVSSRIPVFSNSDTYPAGADPWSGAATKADLPDTYRAEGFTPEDRLPAQYANRLLHDMAEALRFDRLARGLPTTFTRIYDGINTKDLALWVSDRVIRINNLEGSEYVYVPADLVGAPHAQSNRTGATGVIRVSDVSSGSNYAMSVDGRVATFYGDTPPGMVEDITRPTGSGVVQVPAFSYVDLDALGWSAINPYTWWSAARYDGSDHFPLLISDLQGGGGAVSILDRADDTITAVPSFPFAMADDEQAMLLFPTAEANGPGACVIWRDNGVGGYSVSVWKAPTPTDPSMVQYGDANEVQTTHRAIAMPDLATGDRALVPDTELQFPLVWKYGWAFAHGGSDDPTLYLQYRSETPRAYVLPAHPVGLWEWDGIIYVALVDGRTYCVDTQTADTASADFYQVTTLPARGQYSRIAPLSTPNPAGALTSVRHMHRCAGMLVVQLSSVVGVDVNDEVRACYMPPDDPRPFRASIP